MKKIVIIILVLTYFMTSTLTIFGKTELEYPFEKLKLELTKEELLFIKELQNETIQVASYSESKSNVFILENIEKTFGLDFVFVEFDNFGNTLKAVEDGVVKLTSQVTYSDERDKVLAFSRANTVVHAHIFANDFRIFEKIEQSIIGVEDGTIWGDVMLSSYPYVELVSFQNFEEALELLDNGTIDGVLSDDKFYENFIYAGKYPVDVNNRLDIASTSIVGTKNEMEPLLSAISKYTRTDEFEDALVNYYINYYKQTNEVYLKKLLEKADIEETIKVGISILPPFTDKVRGEYVGIIPELFTKAMESAQLDFEFVEVEDYSFTLGEKMLLSGEVDLLMPAMDTVINREKFEFSEQRYTDESIIVKRKFYDKRVFKNVKELAHETIGLVEGSVYLNYFENVFPLKDFVFYKNEAELIRGLKDEEVNIIPIYNSTFLEYINDTKDFSVEKNNSIKNFLDVDVTVAAKKNQKGIELVKIVDAAYRTLDKSKIEVNYHNPLDYEVYYKSQKKTFDLIVSVLVLSLLIAILLVIKLYKLSRTDSLCKIYNREALVKDYKKGIKENETMIFFDINNFKEFNDLYGHSVGDEVLKVFVNSYKGEEKFKMYRIGGDEYLVIADFSKKKTTITEYVDMFLFQNIYSKVADCNFPITASIGILPGKYGIKDLGESLSIVDMAMYEAKSLQISKTYINKEKLDEYKEKIAFRKKLRTAIREKEIYAHFQPIFDFNTDKVIGVEVFSRWKMDGSYVPTSTYIEIARLLSIEIDIDIISLEHASKLYKKLEQEGILPENFKIHLNIADLSIRRLARNEHDILDYGIPKEVLVLEVKEVLLNNERCKENVNKLIQRGYNFSVDNYLSCNSSPKNINSSLLKSIKLDGSLLTNDENSKLFIKSQVDMLNTLNKKVYVQTIEQKWQLNFFKALGVVKGQGYYLCKPLGEEDICNFIKNNVMINSNNE